MSLTDVGITSVAGLAKQKPAHPLGCQSGRDGGHGARRLCPPYADLLLPPLQHDLAARLAGFQQRVRTPEIGGVDGPEGLIERRAQDALVDEVGDIVEQHVLADHVRGLER
jgi:hypothetical protein